jgi:hypothetical protein
VGTPVRIRIPAPGLLEAIFEVSPDNDRAVAESVSFRLDGEEEEYTRVRVSV